MYTCAAIAPCAHGDAAALTAVAIVFPYFLDMVSIVTAIRCVVTYWRGDVDVGPSRSVVLSVYVFPSLFFWKLRTSTVRHGFVKTLFIRFGLLLIIAFGLTGSGLSLAGAVPQLISDVSKGGNPFANLFTFGCPPPPPSAGGNSTNSTSSAPALVCSI